jgi:hypothetical protein
MRKDEVCKSSLGSKWFGLLKSTLIKFLGLKISSETGVAFSKYDSGKMQKSTLNKYT